MSSFSCPHFDMEDDCCQRLHMDCVPGCPGCVLCQNSVFAVPVQQRIHEKAEARERERGKQEGQDKGFPIGYLVGSQCSSIIPSPT